jgi:hypothetical protein
VLSYRLGVYTDVDKKIGNLLQWGRAGIGLAHALLSPSHA